MIDLHCHLLPSIDDGAKDLNTALEMARIAVEDGITLTACTPHIYPGLYENRAASIKQAVTTLQTQLNQAGIPLSIAYGADIQMVPELVHRLRNGTYPTIHGTRYFLFEPPHHIAPVRFAESIHDALAAGYVPLITHPERLNWLDDDHYVWFLDAALHGAWIQLTAGSLTGRFGKRAQYWSERFLDDGVIHLLATDAHDTKHRPPLLAEGQEAAGAWVGPEESELLVSGRPRQIMNNANTSEIPAPPGLREGACPITRRRQKAGWLSRLFG